MTDQNGFWLAKCWNWSENGQWLTVKIGCFIGYYLLSNWKCTGNMTDQNRFWSAKCWNWSENGQWLTVISPVDTYVIRKPTEMSHLAYSISLAQLIATLIHYLCTVAFIGLADWSAFLEQVLLSMQRHEWDNGPIWRAQDGKYGSDIHPCVSEMSLRPSRLVWAYDKHSLDLWILKIVLLEGI